MKKILVILIALLLSFSAQAQVYDLIRSIITINPANFESPVLPFRDTAYPPGLDEFTHTGTMTIENGFVTMDTLECVNNLCDKENKTRKIVTLLHNNKTIVTTDEDSSNSEDKATEITSFFILSLSPTIILMKPNENGTVEISEWALRQ